MVEQTLTAESHIVEHDYNRLPSVDEISEMSVRNHISKRLLAFNMRTPIHPADEGWPDYETLRPPLLVLQLGEVANAGVELGSDGSRYTVAVYVFARSGPERTRLGAVLKDIFRKTIPIYNYVTGTEVDAEPTGEYFITDDVGWTPIPHIYNAPDAERWRAVVNTVLRRIE